MSAMDALDMFKQTAGKGFRPGFVERYAEKRGESKLMRIARELTKLHASTPLSEWQTNRITEIRNAGEFHIKKLYQQTRVLELNLMEEYAQHELDFIVASNQFKKDNPGKVWEPTLIGKVRRFSQSLLKSFSKTYATKAESN